MTDKEKIRAEIERLRKTNKVSEDKVYAQYELDVKCGYDIALDDMLSFINSLPEEPVCPCEECAAISVNCKDVCCKFKKFTKENKQKEPASEDLEKISYYFACMCHPLKTAYSTSSPNPDVIKAFEAGAKWQKEKDIKWIEQCCDSDLLDRSFLNDFKQTMEE